ncbi:WXG100 family type VII secretion target [Streptomyces beihaiensis]|uniref:WXG100 family type VII secretion target n=1 Tax=Streptomyces beihaiensis TaxID=2984495 RepID=A0ABT3U0M8_9ACTN|nr:hypothetical protein [Streptomyces beihaiensis]MCX3061768.1 hypothetical protein [Streptomyces beihaiensis]
MAGEQRLEDAAVVALERQMSDKYDGIRKRAHNLQGVIDGLEGQWAGIGRAEFDKKQYEINESLRNIGGILTEVMEAMNKARHIKNTTEDQVRASVSKIDPYDGASSLSSY